MPTMEKQGSTNLHKQLIELADAHCHLDMVPASDIEDSLSSGVRTMINCGVDPTSNRTAIKICDGKNIFSMLGVDPEHVVSMSRKQLDEELAFIRKSMRAGVVGIGEIGLDQGAGIEKLEWQKEAFRAFIDLSLELNLPVSVHSRNSLDEVLTILEEKKAKKAHIHFFEGGIEQAKRVERLGYMLSIPALESGRRRKVIKEVSIDNIMVESDAPVAVKLPKDVIRAVEMIAEEKRITVEQAASAVVANTKRFFGTEAKPQKSIFMRS